MDWSIRRRTNTRQGSGDELYTDADKLLQGWFHVHWHSQDTTFPILGSQVWVRASALTISHPGCSDNELPVRKGEDKHERLQLAKSVRLRL